VEVGANQHRVQLQRQIKDTKETLKECLKDSGWSGEKYIKIEGVAHGHKHASMRYHLPYFGADLRLTSPQPDTS